MQRRTRWTIGSLMAILLTSGAARSVEAESLRSDAKKATAPSDTSDRNKLPVTTLPVSIEQGHLLYTANCAACHGEQAKGNGPAAMVLKVHPREFINEDFRYISSDGVASEDDLYRTIRFGRRNAQMPAFPYLMDEEVHSLDLYLREVNRKGVFERLKAKFKDKPEMTEEKLERVSKKQTQPGQPISWTAPSGDFKPDTAKGRVLFAANCAACHGPEGRGDGLKTAVDSQGKPIKARDLTQGDLRGGREPLEIFWRVRCGIPGTPMPALKTLDDNDVWQIVNFVRQLMRPK